MSLSRETSVELISGSLIGFWPNSIIIFLSFFFFFHANGPERKVTLIWGSETRTAAKHNLTRWTVRPNWANGNELIANRCSFIVLFFPLRPFVSCKFASKVLVDASLGAQSSSNRPLHLATSHITRTFVHLQPKNRKCVVLLCQLCSPLLSQACQKSCSTTALLCSPHSLSALITSANSPPRCTEELAAVWGVGLRRWR